MQTLHYIFLLTMNKGTIYLCREKKKERTFLKVKTMKLLNTNESRLMRSDYFVIMVSLLTAALIMLPLFMSAKSRGNEIPATVKMEDSLSFRYVTCTRAAIVFTTHEPGKCNLYVETKDGNEVLYSEIIRNIGKSARVFDFLNLEDGAYKIVAKKNGKTLERAFTIKGGELIYNGRVVVDPIFKTSGTRAIIELPNEQGKQVLVKVLDSRGEELYSAIENREVRKNFEFSNVEAGKYTVFVAVDDDNYEFDYSKQ